MLFMRLRNPSIPHRAELIKQYYPVALNKASRALSLNYGPY